MSKNLVNAKFTVNIRFTTLNFEVYTPVIKKEIEIAKEQLRSALG